MKSTGSMSSSTLLVSSASAAVSLPSGAMLENVSGARRRTSSRSAAALRPVASVRSCSQHDGHYVTDHEVQRTFSAGHSAVMRQGAFR